MNYTILDKKNGQVPFPHLMVLCLTPQLHSLNFVLAISIDPIPCPKEYNHMKIVELDFFNCCDISNKQRQKKDKEKKQIIYKP